MKEAPQELQEKIQKIFSVLYQAISNSNLYKKEGLEQWKYLAALPEFEEGKKNVENWFKQYPDNQFVQAVDELVNAIQHYSRQPYGAVSVETFMTNMPNKATLYLWDKCDKTLHGVSSSFGM